MCYINLNFNRQLVPPSNFSLTHTIYFVLNSTQHCWDNLTMEMSKSWLLSRAMASCTAGFDCGACFNASNTCCCIRATCQWRTPQRLHLSLCTDNLLLSTFHVRNNNTTKDDTDLTFSGQHTVLNGHSVHFLDNADKFRAAQKNLDGRMATLWQTGITEWAIGASYHVTDRTLWLSILNNESPGLWWQKLEVFKNWSL